MKKPTRSYNLRSSGSRTASKTAPRTEVTSSVTYRVCKKIAKTIYFSGRRLRVSLRHCRRAAELIESKVLRTALDFEDYKAKIVSSVQRLAENERAAEDLSARAASGDFEDWVAGVLNQ